eukprot:UN07408
MSSYFLNLLAILVVTTDLLHYANGTSSLSCGGTECVNTTKTCASSQNVCQITCPSKGSCKNLNVSSDSITTTISCIAGYSCQNIAVICGSNVKTCRITSSAPYAFIDSSLQCSINGAPKTNNNTNNCTLQCVEESSCIAA